ncbi:MAG: M23 family metallopeptidase [Rhodospirillum sp.]|nr:M23 family metallopeptidase [Rhodospirillum sp.]MCF8499105.1 M23 family metallopeptidase [Rhodospirillum sp.]
MGNMHGYLLRAAILSGIGLSFGLFQLSNRAAAQETGGTPPDFSRVETQPRLVFPLDCAIGKDCWVTSYVDDDPGPGVADFMCGPLSKRDSRPGKEGSDIGHKGVDIGIGHLESGRSVSVLAAAAGTVAGVRDEMPDISTRAENPPDVSGRECGNGVRIDHGDGWATQYCHMKRGSIAVHPGQTVQSGQILGDVGLSGMTEHPHLHIQISRDDVVYDPFKGRPAEEGCKGTGIPLWTPEVFAKMRYSPLVLNNVGFAWEKPDRPRVRNGVYAKDVFPSDAPVLLVFVDMMGVEKGDHLLLQIIGPDGAPFHESKSDFDEKGYAQWFGFSGKKRGGQDHWPLGTYTGVVTVERPGKGVVGWREARIRVE